jgi:hypothetical protein
MMKLEKVENALLKLGKTAVLAAAVFVVGCGGGSGGGQPCPADGPLTNLKNACDDRIHIYESANGQVLFGLTTSNGVNGANGKVWTIIGSICLGTDNCDSTDAGPSQSRTRAKMTRSCVSAGCIDTALASGSFAEIKDQATLLSQRLIFESGNEYNFDNFKYIRSISSDDSASLSRPTSSTAVDSLVAQITNWDPSENDPSEAGERESALEAIQRALQESD